MNLAFLLAAVVVLTQASETLPDFSRSAATVSPAAPRTGDVIRYELRVRNEGGPAATSSVSSELPHGYLIDFAGGCAGAKLDPETRHAVWYEGPIATEETKTCTIRMLSRRTAAGTQANIYTAVSAFRPQAYLRFAAEAELGSVPDPHRVRVGSFYFSRVGIVALIFLGVFLLGISVPAALVPGGQSLRASGVRAPWSVSVLCVGFLAMFASLGYDDYRAATQYRESRCAVFDHEVARIETRETRGTRVASVGKGVVYDPVFALRYEVDGVETFSSGFGTPTRLSFGSTGPSSRAVEQFRIGTTHPCWYDPQDVKTVLLDRSPGGAYFFAVIPFIVLLCTGRLLWSRLRRANRL